MILYAVLMDVLFPDHQATVNKVGLGRMDANSDVEGRIKGKKGWKRAKREG
jgi:hypothetical protein